MKSIYFFKKLALITVAMVFMQGVLNAQYVTIPDANFVTYLQATFPTAISGNQLDTTNSSIVNATTVDVYNLSIGEISGIQYFDNLETLNCSNNNLSFIAEFPPKLQVLNCSANPVLTGLPNLPPLMRYIECHNNPFFSFLPALPPTMELLNALSCPALTSLPPLPSGLDLLDVSNCSNLFVLPTLPDSLTTLHVDYCPAASAISILPAYIQFYSCMGNNLTSLPELPTTLSIFYCTNNAITCLPQLPTNMQELHAINNTVTCLPNIPTNPFFTSDIGTTLCNGIASNFNGTPISCYGACDGDLVLTSTSVVPLDYIWSNGFNDNNNSSGVSGITSLCAGGYSVTVTPSSGGCNSYLTTSLTQPTQQQLGQPTIDPMICNGDSTWVYFPGNPPFNFQWSTGAIADSVYLPVGTYTVTVLTGPCDVLPATFTVMPYITVGIPLNAGYCIGSSAQVCAGVIGGTAPYTYQWNGTPIPNNCGLVDQPINYDVLVTDLNGCTGFSSFTPSVFPLPSFSGVSTNTIVCNANPVTICIPSVIGGTQPYFYQWSNGAATTCIAISVGTYAYTVVDANGCIVSAATNVTYSPGWVGMDLTNIMLPSCGACDGQATVTFSGANPVASYLWQPGNITVPTNYSICDNTDSYVVITDTAGCVDTLNFSLSCHAVWPGDANNDGVANNVDLLAIGVGYGTYDVARPNATINWQAEIGLDWIDSLANGTNYKHIDCNGDGIIADDDTIALLQNYGFTHPLRLSAKQNNITDPPFYFDVVVDTIGTSQQLDIPLLLGTASLPMDSIYGIAFTVNYDTSLVKADSISMSFPYCWLGNYGTEAISITKNDPLNGKIYAAITRITHVDTSGFGEVARLTVVTTDNVSGRLMSPVYDTLSFTISDVAAINLDQNNRPVSILNDSLIIEDLTAINDIELLTKTEFYPNPVTDLLTIEVPGQVQIQGVEVMDVLGQTTNYFNADSGTFMQIKLNGQAKGMYEVRVITDKGIVTKKISIVGN